MVELLEVLDDLSVEYGANIKGRATWKNKSLVEGETVLVVFFLGSGGTPYVFTHQGVEYFLGSIIEAVAPAIDASVTTEIPSRAMFSGTWDVQAVIGYTVGNIRYVLSNGRCIGLNRADVEAGYLVSYASAWFTSRLTVAPAGAPAEVTDFEFVAA